MGLWHGYYERVAAALREVSPSASIAVIDGDKAGYWIEAEDNGIVATAGTQDGPWGVTLYARDEAVARARCTDSRSVFATEVVDGNPEQWWWFDNREDGPDHHTAPAAVAAYIAGAMAGQEGN